MREGLSRFGGMNAAVLAGVLFGPIMGAQARLEYHASWVGAVLLGIGEGVGFGLVQARAIRRQRRKHGVVLGGLSPTQCALVERAAWRGAMPDDPLLLERAAALARHMQDESRRGRPVTLAVISTVLLAGVFFAATQSAWWLLGVGSAGIAAVVLWHAPDRYRRRAELLGG